MLDVAGGKGCLAVELASQSDCSVASVAADLGIPVSSLGRWKRELQKHGNKAFVGQGVARDAEFMALRRELSKVKRECDFLRHAAAYFAKDDT